MVRSPTNNPFEPGSDRVPQVWAGRHAELNDWRDRIRPRRAAGLYERGRALLGEPGIGKSVLVRRLCAQATQQGDAATEQVRLPRGVDPLPLVAEAVLALADQLGLPARRERAIADLLGRVRRITVAGTGASLAAARDGLPHVALTRLLVEIGRVAMADGRVALVHLDEVQNVAGAETLSQLLVALGDALAHEEPVPLPGGQGTAHLPLAVYLTGLPEFADFASSVEGATFVRRFATTLLEPISDDDLHMSLVPFVRDGWPVLSGDGQAHVSMTPGAAQAIVAACHGDPFLFQLAGQHAWDAGSSAVVTAEEVAHGWVRARQEARRHVERLVDRLPDLERSLLEAMAQLPPEERTATRLARRLGYEQASQIGAATRRLDTIRGIIRRGAPYTFRARTVEAYLGGDWP